MLSRWKLFKVLVKSHFHYLCGSRRCAGKNENLISDESFIFESESIYYIVSLRIVKELEGDKS